MDPLIREFVADFERRGKMIYYDIDSGIYGTIDDNIFTPIRITTAEPPADEPVTVQRKTPDSA